MDTDRATELADLNITSAVNEDFLIASCKSSQLSTDLKRYKLDCCSNSYSINSTNNLYGSIAPVFLAPNNRHNYSKDNTNQERSKSESSWLLKHYMPNISRKSENLIAHNNSYSLNNHLYDNISFADSTFLTNSKTVQSENNKNDFEPIAEPKNSFCFGNFRILLSCYLLLGITLSIYSRNALSLAVVGMVADNNLNAGMFANLNTSLDINTDGSCPVFRRNQSNTIEIMPSLVAPADLFSMGHLNSLELEYKASIKRRIERGELVDWSPSEQGMIFAAGSVGNLLIAIPLTRMGEVYGSKWIIFIALFGATIQSALTPILAPCSIVLNCIFQMVFCGLSHGADCVAYTFFAHWLTPIEMSFFVSCLLICYQLGSIISSFVTASILTNEISWCWCFYTPAILCGIWTLIWCLIGASEPYTCWLISRKELNFLIRNSKLSEIIIDKDASAEHQDGQNNSNLSKSFKNNNNRVYQKSQASKDSLSWSKLAKDPNLWAIISVKFTLRWYFSVYGSLMPTYLASVTHMSVDTIGNMNVFQSFICLISGIWLGYLTRAVIVRRPFGMSLAAFRKLFQSIVNFGLVASMLVFITFDCNHWVIILTITISGICINFYVAGALQLPLDLSPTYCGLITSVSNTLALGQALGAPISGFILNKGPKDRSLWRAVWGLAILLNTLSGLLFIFLVDSKPRDYSKHSERLERGDINHDNREKELLARFNRKTYKSRDC